MQAFTKYSPILLSSIILLTGCDQANTNVQANEHSNAASTQNKPALTVAEFLAAVEQEKTELGIEEARAAWINQNFITDDTSLLSAKASQKMTEANVRFAIEAAKFDDVEVTADQRRKLQKLKQSIVLPAPQDSQKSARLAKLATDMNSMYGKGSYTTAQGETLNLGEMSKIIAHSRNYDELLDIWQGWRKISVPMKPLYEEQVTLANEGAQALGYQDLGAMWRSNYDMPADEFSQELDKQWQKIKPLYDDLHCYVKGKITETYGADKMPSDGTIPAHLLGNMWGQSWGNIYDLVAPDNADPGYDLTEQLHKHQVDEIAMVKTAEKFFTSIGFEPLPESFWQHSLFIKPKDRDVVCHASAWSMDGQDDIRIKMCIEKTAEDFSTIHHELGHSFYQRAYKAQPVFYQTSANDGIHEAIGDTIALSVTPKYLKEIGLIEQIPDESKDIGLLMKMALDKVAFIPFGLLVDQWRWGVFSGEITPENYNSAWWQLRKKYQGISSPIARPSDAFDPGAKYHIPGNTPYSRYFLAHIQQFEFHRALCDIAGNTESIHRCSIYNNKAAGKKLNEMLTLGASQPWQQAYKILTGNEHMDASAILDYFAPLHLWLKNQNQGKTCQF